MKNKSQTTIFNDPVSSQIAEKVKGAVASLESSADVILYGSRARNDYRQRFVKTGIVSKDIAEIYNALFEKRQESDYEVFVDFKKEDVIPWLHQANIFVKEVTDLASNN